MNLFKYITDCVLIGVAACLLAASACAAEIVVVVNPKNPLSRMPAEQAAQYFLGRSTQFTPLELADGTAVRNEFYQKVLDKDPSQVKAIWTKLVFTGKGVAPKTFGSPAELKKALASDVDAVGFLPKSQVDDSVKVVLTVP